MRQRAGRPVGLEEAAREMVVTGVGLKRAQRTALAPFLKLLDALREATVAADLRASV